MVRRKEFTRSTSSGYFIPQIDGLRCLAMLLVILHHVFAVYLEQTHRLGTQELPRDWTLIMPRSALILWALHLTIGVPIFFFISGFVLALPFAKRYVMRAQPPSYGIYLLGRLIRLQPPYFLNLAFLFLVIVFPWHQPHAMGYFLAKFKAFAPHLLASLIYLHAAIYRQSSWISGITWTLEIDMQFYLLLPFLAKLFLVRRKILRRAVFLILIITSAFIAQFVIPQTGNIQLTLSLPILLHFFLAGVLLADLYLDTPQLAKFGPRIGDALALTSGALLVYVLHWQPVFAWTEPLLIIVFCLAIFRGAWSSAFFQLPLLTTAGAMSYTVYLYHSFIVRQLLPYTIQLFPPTHQLWWDSAVQFTLLLAPIFGISALLFWLTERPFMMLSHEMTRHLRRQTPEHKASASA